MSDLNSESDDIESSFSVFSELELADSISNVSSSPARSQEDVGNYEYNFTKNIIRCLQRRECGFGDLKVLPIRSYHLQNVFPQQVLSTHVFMGMSRCGRFLITYTMLADQDDDEWYATIYKYRLHWWNFKPAGQARKIAEVSLFGNYKICTPLQIYICQWPNDHEKVLVYGLIKETITVDATAGHQRAFITVTALPSLTNCQECRVVASSYLLDDIAASWDTCLRFSCLRHGYTVHTSFDIVVPYPEFVPKVSLKCHNYAVFNTNNFLYAIKIDLENCEQKQREETSSGENVLVDTTRDVEANVNSLECDENIEPAINLTDNQRKALQVKEQIIRDFTEEIHLNSFALAKKMDNSTNLVNNNCDKTDIRDKGYEFVKKENDNQSLGSDSSATLGNCKKQYDIANIYEVETHCLDNNFLVSDVSQNSENFNLPTEDQNVKCDCISSSGDSESRKSEVNPVTICQCEKSDSVNKISDAQSQKCAAAKTSQDSQKSESINSGADSQSQKSDDFFRSPQNIVRVYSKQSQKNVERYVKTEEVGCSSQRKLKPIFTRHKVQRNYSGLYIRKKILTNGPGKSLFKFKNCEGESSYSKCNLLSKYITKHLTDPTPDNEYDFVDDSHSEVEKISLFRKKRLADKKYEFQDFDSENIIPFSIVRQENISRSPRKSNEAANMDRDVDKEEDCPILDELTVSVSAPSPSPRSPLLIDVLSSPTQYVESVLRPFNRNTNNSNPLSPLAKYLSSPPSATHKFPRSPNINKTKLTDDSCNKYQQYSETSDISRNGRNLIQICHKLTDTRLILKNGILVSDISQRYFINDNTEKCIYINLFDNLSKFEGRCVRFKRRYVEVDDELVSVLTDIEDEDDMSSVTGYHTALNVEVHGAGYVQLQMISNLKAEKLMTPCLVFDQLTLDIEGVCHSVATALCKVSNKTFTFCNDYDIEILDVCPRSSEVFVLLMMRIEGCDGIRDEVSKIEHYEASVTFTWSLITGNYNVRMVVPPQRVDWEWNEKAVWNPAKEASKRFRLQLPADVTMCEPAVRVLTNISTFKGVSLSRIEDYENGVSFVL